MTKLDSIKNTINDKLLADFKSNNKKLMNEFLKENKNPILDAIKDMIKIEKKKGGKSIKTNFPPMLPANICALIDPVMQEKVWIDLEREIGPIEQRKNKPFHQFIYDSVIMQKGLQSIAVRTLYSLTTGLQVFKT